MAPHDDDLWVLTRYGPTHLKDDDTFDRHFLAPDLTSWVEPFAEAWQATLDEVEVEIGKRITHVFYDDERKSYHPCPAAEVFLRKGVDDQ